ncbi:FAD-binding oxidoreductase [Plasticicumulans acidivorans]|uniref:FAD/FMN-containing dehydrogenase n=1 Tax=Plasticicumulans acidivorans TaxID=886464 RepID=A0A317MWV7_9GAMM|nr:FAD-binding oxidoreductase [Plasticicumulans acidivorans]PWV59353.1 FAD/FMN-containing dehydrogenase [Plasticicumulans acidivorans]
MAVEGGVYRSWGRYPAVGNQRIFRLHDRFAALSISTEVQRVLPYGHGRSYGDVCLNDGGGLLHTRGLDRFIAFDVVTGVLRCEAGVLLAEILDLVVPRGWFLPVTPGTRFVTVGGALANDVHGKNHHLVGTFGCHVRRFELLRSDGERFECSPHESADWFGATIGGLGLTGLVTWVELQLRRIANPWIAGEVVRFHSLEEFAELSRAADGDYEYTVSWIDCAAAVGRGLFMCGNHAPALSAERPQVSHKKLRVPFTPPVSLISGLTLRAFNALYYRKQLAERTTAITHYEPFFYPLDGLLEWNRIYGPRGFLQYQCVVPVEGGLDLLHEVLGQIAASGSGSVLAVLKQFGDIPSPGWLSFPRSGFTLALDFPNYGERTLQLLERLDVIVRTGGGRLYPAKDARMAGDFFRQSYTDWERFSAYVDPQFSSDFWRRVME